MAVIDASFLIDLERQTPAATKAYKALVEQGGPLLVPAHAAMEYLAGYDELALNLADLERSFRLVPFGRRHLIQSAQAARTSILAGNFPGSSDAAVASTAILEDDIMVTADPEHFRALGCRVWDYRNETEPPTQ